MNKLFDIDSYINIARDEGIPIRAGKAASDDLIRKAEEALGFSLPEEYVSFLKQFGFLSIAGEEIFGLVNGDFTNSGIPDAIWISLKEREDSGMPEKYLIFGNTGHGGYYVLDLSVQNKMAPVIEWVPGKMLKGDEGEYISGSFAKFCSQRINDAIEYW